MRTLRLVLCLFLLLGSLAQGEILIFKGAVRAKSLPAGRAPRVMGVYYLFDTQNNQLRVIDFNSSRSNKDKQMFAGPTTGYQSGSASLPRDQSASVIVVDQAANGAAAPGAFSVSVEEMVGTNTALACTSEAAAAKVTFPKTLILRTLAIGGNAGLAFRNTTQVTLLWQRMLTLRENDAKHTLDQAVKAVMDDLVVRGYPAPWAPG